MSSISRLPSSTTRLISSHVVVVTPVLLVKELLDNAIDAKATSVEVLISSDTISKIEVRDDGTGIHPDDYDMLGRRGYTSKLRTIEELGNLFGKTLGFRGEALASANSMANVTVTTKISTEPVAAVLQLIPNEGGVLTQKPASAPEGTTVSVTKLFGRQPVREQMAIKDSKRNLDKVQELLRAYAMARPHIKLLFKILQTPTKIWSYSPKRNATAVEAVLQLFGTETASNCLTKSSRTAYSDKNRNSTTSEPLMNATNSFVLEALLANPDTDFRKMPKRRYISVDGRPLNCGRGIAKRLSIIYSEFLNRYASGEGANSEYFIRLNICCPPGAYDANIEPHKDNVLFSDERAILDAFKQLCGEVYKSSAPSHQEIRSTANSHLNEVPMTEISGRPSLNRPQERQAQVNIADCNLQLVTDSLNPFYHSTNSPIDYTLAMKGSACSQGPSGAQGSITFTPINTSSPVDPSNQQRKSPLVISPQIIDVSMNPHGVDQNNHRRRPVVPVPLNSQEAETMENEERTHGNHLRPCETTKTSSLSDEPVLNPNLVRRYAPVSPSSPEPPLLRHVMAAPGDLEVPRSYRDAETVKVARPQRSIVPGGPYRTPVSSPSDGKSRGIPIAPFNGSRTTLPRRGRLPWTPSSSLEKPHCTNNLNLEPSHLEGTDRLKQTQIPFGGARSRRRPVAAQSVVLKTQALPGGSPNRPEADSSLDIQDMFSTAKTNLHYQLSQENSRSVGAVCNRESRQQHQQLSRQRQPFSTLQTNTFKNSENSQETQEPVATTLPTGDPRAYLLRRQKSISAEESGAKPRKLRRVKSFLMPLENIPTDGETHNLSCTISIDDSYLDQIVKWTRKHDEYVIYGTFVDGLDMSLAEGRIVESRLQKLLGKLKENMGDQGNGGAQVNIDLLTTLKGKTAMDALTISPSLA